MEYIYLLILLIFVVLLIPIIFHKFFISFLKQFEKSCYKIIEKRDEEISEKEKFNKALKKWLFK